MVILMAAIVCAIIASLAYNYAMYISKKAVMTLPEVKLRLSRSVIKAFLTNRLWLTGMTISLFGSALYAFALTVAPISIIQPVMGCGIALLAYLAIKNLGEKPRRIDLVAIGLSVLGVILIGVSLAEGLPEKVKYSAVALWTFSGVLAAVALIVLFVMSRGSDAKKGAGLGIASGMLGGTSVVFAKLVLVDWSSQWTTKGVLVFISSPAIIFVIAWIATMGPSIVILQAALQKGMAIIVVPLLAGLSQLIPIALGMVALHEKMPKSLALSVMRVVAFALILIATFILSKRAEEELLAE
ncbi:MAG: hypothetical protein CVT63_04235 [Candidatus Anoxymicrobium japonicum]|uniref:EamA domain-containing protein n=1 Tax=Candidatus Anoxymicrobium japonicum TaxID=2013648 RepID=A0A2N3G6C0_9ACTN|nr:MAG: hypothetical protein CVT63_04235 [Candidatus Anoxymicrobium japonicum]